MKSEVIIYKSNKDVVGASFRDPRGERHWRVISDLNIMQRHESHIPLDRKPPIRIKDL